MDNVTSIEPQSIAADKEEERKMRTFRVLREIDAADPSRRISSQWAGGATARAAWIEEDTYATRWNPDAEEVGEQYGEGDYLLVEEDDKYDFRYVYPMRVVAEKRYRLAADDE